MAEFDVRLDQMLDGYATFLKQKGLALVKHQPYLVRRVREFLLFAREHGGYTFGARERTIGASLPILLVTSDCQTYLAAWGLGRTDWGSAICRGPIDWHGSSAIV